MKRIYWIGAGLFLGFSSLVYFNHLATFSFVDEFNNFVVPWFMLQGKLVYKDVFFNHQILPAVVSMILQLITKPETLYQLVLIHRLFVIGWSAAWCLLLLYRFRYVALGFVLLHESTKYSLFGHLFQAEGLIVYPLVYLVCLCWEKLEGKKHHLVEYLLAAVMTWLVVFMRETFAPLGLFLFGVFLTRPWSRKTLLSILLFSVMSFATVLPLPIKDYAFSLIDVNRNSVIADELGQQGGVVTSVLKSASYPITLLFSGKNTPMRVMYIITTVQLLLIFALLYRAKELPTLLLAFSVIALTLAVLRIVEPGLTYYAAYKLLPWQGVFFTLLFLFLKRFFAVYGRTKTLQLFSLPFLAYAAIILRPDAFFWENIARQDQFTTNYAEYFTNGAVARVLSNTGDTLFVDGYASLVFWEAKLPSSFRQSLYYPVMNNTPSLVETRKQMFLTQAPTFYYESDCDPKMPSRLPTEVQQAYKRLTYIDRGTCLFVHTSKIPEISQDQLESVKRFGYAL